MALPPVVHGKAIGTDGLNFNKNPEVEKSELRTLSVESVW